MEEIRKKDAEILAKKQKEREEKERVIREKEERRLTIEQKFEKIKAQHGGIHGTDDTGYDENEMALYIKGEEIEAVQLGQMI